MRQHNVPPPSTSFCVACAFLWPVLLVQVLFASQGSAGHKEAQNSQEEQGNPPRGLSSSRKNSTPARHRGFASDQWVVNRGLPVRHRVELHSRRPAAKFYRILAKSGVRIHGDQKTIRSKSAPLACDCPYPHLFPAHSTPTGNAVKDFIRKIREYRRATSFPRTLNPNGGLQQSLGSPWQRRTPGKTIQNPLNPDGVPHRNCQLGFKNRGMWNPVGVQINSNSLTWGAPQSDDPRLCCETRTGFKRRDSCSRILHG